MIAFACCENYFGNISLLTSFGVTVAWAIWGWGQNEMGFHAGLAMILGIVITSLVGFGL